jgi:hypothetical protein
VHYLTIGFLTIILYISSVTQAHAYLDPGTGMILMQAIAGAIAAFLVMWKGFTSRIKNLLSRICAFTKKNESN